ncbi:MAG: AAA family ATPase [Synechococcaceae cyanobacterium]
MVAAFLLGEQIQKSLKAWRQGLGLKPEPPVAAAPPPTPAAGQVVSGTDNQTLEQASAGGNLTVASGGAQVENTTIGRDRVEGDQYNAPTTVQNAQTIKNAQTIHNHNAPPDKRERVLSTIDPAPQGVGVMGREEQLADLEARMGEPGNDRRLVVHGESGVGKSELLREYARRHASRYPGGRYWIDCRLNLAQEIASIGRNCWQMDWLEGPLDEQASSVLQQLAKDKVLLLLDNASSQEQLKPFLPPAGQAHVLISSTSRDWAPPMVEVWRHEGLQRLARATGLALLERVAGAEVARQVGAQVIKQLGGLPVHLLPTARTLAQKARLGRLSDQALVQLSAEGVESFSIPWQALDVAGRWLLQAAARWFNPSALVEAELVAALQLPEG